MIIAETVLLQAIYLFIFFAALNNSVQYTVILYNAAWCIGPLLFWQNCNLQFSAKVF